MEDELELNNLYNRSEMDNETKQKIWSYVYSKSQRNVRSTARWTVKGEKSNSYFCTLKKMRQEKKYACHAFFLIEYILIYDRLMKILDICVRRTFKLRNLIKPIDRLSSGKSPGPDGLTPEFYKFEGFIVSSLS